MLFRVKSVASGETVKVQAEGTLNDLHAAIRAATGASDVRVSLNRKTEIIGDGSLYDLGLRSGDVVYLLDAASAAGDPPATGARGATSGDGSSSRAASASAAQLRDPGGAPAPLNVRGGGALAAASTLRPAADMAAASASTRERAFAEMRLRATCVLSAAKPATAHEFLVTLLHAVMLDAGFVTAEADAAGMPAGWKQHAGLFSLEYTHAQYTPTTYAALPTWPSRPPVAQLKAFGMGELIAAGPALLVVQGIVAHPGDSALVTSQLRLTQLLSPHALAGAAGASAWESLDSLSAADRFVGEVRAHVIEPLLAQLARSSAKPLLVALGGELRVQTLRHLDARSLAAVGAVCRELRDAARDGQLWRDICLRELGMSDVEPPGGWRSAYVHAVQLKRQRERERQRADEDMRAHAQHLWPHGPARPHPMWPGGPIPQPGFPGMIGGDYDRLPGGLPSGPLGGGPLGPPFGDGRSEPRGPFGDPDGRLPLGAAPPGSRYDPIHPELDFDGGFGGGGGVPMPGRGPFRGPDANRARGRGLHPDLPDPSRFF